MFSAPTGAHPLGGFDDRKKDFDRLCGVTDWRLHDLRRTARTLLISRWHQCRPCRDVSWATRWAACAAPTTGTPTTEKRRCLRSAGRTDRAHRSSARRRRGADDEGAAQVKRGKRSQPPAPRAGDLARWKEPTKAELGLLRQLLSEHRDKPLPPLCRRTRIRAVLGGVADRPTMGPRANSIPEMVRRARRYRARIEVRRGP